MKTKIILSSRDRRRKRIRSKVIGSAERPRLSVFKSNAYIYAQLIDDENGKTLAAASSLKDKKGTKTDSSLNVGTEIAKLGKAAGVSKVVFDRGGFNYTGRIRSLADGARQGGLEF
ncbi:MAG: 50S ribosomal protein L18 [bacterium]